MNLTAIEYHASDEAEFTCVICGRAVKRAVTLSDGGLRGMDCAATAVGRSRHRSTYADLEVEARSAVGRAAGAAYDAQHPPVLRPWPARQAWGRAKEAACPFPALTAERWAFLNS